MTKYRILKETYENGKEFFFIQHKYLNLFWVKKRKELGINFFGYIVFTDEDEAKFWIEEKHFEEEQKKRWKVKQKEIINPQN